MLFSMRSLWKKRLRGICKRKYWLDYDNTSTSAKGSANVRGSMLVSNNNVMKEFREMKDKF